MSQNEFRPTNGGCQAQPFVPPTIIVDEQEDQRTCWERFFEAPTERGKLSTGDYSVKGGTAMVAVERKSLDDFVKSLCASRDRFINQLRRGQSLDRFFVVIEASYEDILCQRYKIDVRPETLLHRIAWYEIAYQAHFIFAGDKETAAKLCELLLSKWVKHKIEMARDLQGGVS